MKRISMLLAVFLLAIGITSCNSNQPKNEKADETKIDVVEDVKDEDKKAEEVKPEEPKADEAKGEKNDLTVFAAASLTESLEEIKEVYEKENPNVNLVYNFDSSGTLKSQIDEGAATDLFISAASKQMNQLDKENDAYDSKAAIDSKTRVDLLENEVTLAVKEGNKEGLSSFEDLATDKVKTIALGNSDVPVGQYSEELLKKLNIWDEIQDKVTFGSNVKEVTSWIEEGAVDTGIIYSTDAKAAGLEVVAKADPSMFDERVIYPAAVLDASTNKEEASKFLDFLKSDKAKEIFEKYGFVTLN